MGPGGSSLPEPVRVAQLPEPLVRRDQGGFHVVPTSVRHGWKAVQHHLQDARQPLGHLKVALVTSLMERDQELVGQPS